MDISTASTDWTRDASELYAWLRLLYTPGVGNRSARRLLATFGLPGAIFAQSASTLQTVLTQTQAIALLSPSPQAQEQLSRTRAWQQAKGSSRALVALGDALYPPALLQLPDPPLLLWMQGRLDLLGNSPHWPASLSMVGSRSPSPVGERTAHEFAAFFASSGLGVVSGMALGIDAAAHSGALDACTQDPSRIATIAVLGGGLDNLYPRQNLALAHRITQHGILLSEFPLGTAALATNFPKRNRLIAALGLGTLVVEAALRSGSLTTARVSLELGHDVFAIPGSIHQPQSKGCHALIKQGAKLVECAEDVLEELRIPPPPSPQATPEGHAPLPAQALSSPTPTPLAHGVSSTHGEAAPNASTDESPRSLLDAMGFDPVGLDALQARTSLPAERLQVLLLELELQNAVARLAGGLYQRLSS